MYGAVLTGKGTYVVGKQQMAFDTKLFPLKDCGKTNPHLSTLYKFGSYTRPAQFTNTSASGSSTSENEGDAAQPDPREQAGGVTNSLSSSILIEDSSDDELVQEVVNEMKDVVMGIAALIRWANKGFYLYLRI